MRRALIQIKGSSIGITVCPYQTGFLSLQIHIPARNNDRSSYDCFLTVREQRQCWTYPPVATTPMQWQQLGQNFRTSREHDHRKIYSKLSWLFGTYNVDLGFRIISGRFSCIWLDPWEGASTRIVKSQLLGAGWASRNLHNQEDSEHHFVYLVYVFYEATAWQGAKVEAIVPKPLGTQSTR